MEHKNQLINRINLKLIHTFLLVADHESFREAAAQAGRSQAAISTQIKQLEQQLGTTLIIRTTRSLTLTHEGELLLTQARKAMQEIAFGLSFIAEAKDLRRGKITLACSPAFAFTKLPKIIADFKREYAGVQIILKEYKSVELLESVRSGEADFGVGPEDYDERLEFNLIQSEPLLAIVPNDLLPEITDTIDLEMLVQLPLITFHQNTILFRIINQAAKGRGLTLDIQYLCIQGLTLVALAEAGLGACILTESVADLSNLQNTRKLMITNPSLFRHFALIKMRGQMLTPASQRLYDLIILDTTPK